MQGILRCSQYAFGPNKLHYCGPDANAEIHAYIQHSAQDFGLKRLLQSFETMFPYLQMIADANNIADPFDPRVVDAYWIGNALLENIGKKKLFRHLIEKQQIKKKLPTRPYEELLGKIAQGALPHHSFHVFDVWRRNGTLPQTDTINVLDSCRISWGRITKLWGPLVSVKTQKLTYQKGVLTLVDCEKKITRTFEANLAFEALAVDDYVSIHWNVICEKLTEEQVARLKRYSIHHLALANKTL